LQPVLDLGEQPVANEMGDPATASDPTFPLLLRACSRCGLGQLGEFVTPEELFASDYPYFSSVSESWVEHARGYAALAGDLFDLSAGQLVVEIASNDGYLLQHFRDAGLNVLGVEPAHQVAEAARARGITTLERFFGELCAQEIVAEFGAPRLVAANNVMAHVPDLQDFARGLATLCDAETVVSVENPSFATLLTDTLFDTVYHEHFSYLSAHSQARLASDVGLELFRVDQLPTHGGSNRYWFALEGRRQVEPSVTDVIAGELQAGLLDEHRWRDFEETSRAAIDGLRDWLTAAAADGRRVGAYGAAAKGNTLLNAVGTEATVIECVADGSPLKQGKVLPGTRIPVVAPDQLPQDLDDIIVLPWNIADELVALVRRWSPGAHCWAAIPSMRRLD
jgi:hypothetical protein